MFDGRFRSSVDRGVGPIGSALGRTGLSPDHLTALGLLLAVPAAFAIGTGRLILGLLLLIASAVPDLLDGALAKASGTSSKRGAFFDSVADRVTDAIILGGLGWYLQSSRHGHAGMLPFGILAVSTLISYERAKAESLGFTAKGGLMERAERIILLCIGLVAPVILVPILWTMLVLTSVTAVQRFVKVWRQASGVAGADAADSAVGGENPPLTAAAAPERAGDGSGSGAGPDGSGVGRPAPPDPAAAMAERWRAWRQQTAARQRGDRMTASARLTGSGHEGDGSRQATRWEERRAARLSRLGVDPEEQRALRAQRRRHSSRRP